MRKIESVFLIAFYHVIFVFLGGLLIVTDNASLEVFENAVNALSGLGWHEKWFNASYYYRDCIAALYYFTLLACLSSFFFGFLSKPSENRLETLHKLSFINARLILTLAFLLFLGCAWFFWLGDESIKPQATVGYRGPSERMLNSYFGISILQYLAIFTWCETGFLTKVLLKNLINFEKEY